ncbi:hypothetical protein OE766_24995 [Pararhizobium sp. YC-54]|uniref:hypothetical protein n=1 Tax=Pararhizobium sp. YC-54 TaxID=2986920 RepID=UPI0021F7B0E2|nr:hypothetical protein [Pararhizobium sp. YC-54]MCW0001483.1 hypothetical protein [Pararhizobium sp. YC-54]
MAIETATETLAKLVENLAEELHHSGIGLHELSEMSGVEKERLELVKTGAWEKLTIMEIGAIMGSLGMGLPELFNRRR